MLTLIIFLMVAGFIAARPPTSPRFIVGGENAERGEFPWQLSLQRFGGISWSHMCGATLLSTDRALCSGRCVDGVSPSMQRVVAGLHKMSEGIFTQESRLTGYILHESYNQDVSSAIYTNDIAILNLETPISATGTAGFATLYSGSDYLVGATCIITGWGRTSDSAVPSDTLQKASSTVVSNAECFYGTNANIISGQICVHERTTNVGACNGDFGGPLNCLIDGSMVVAGVSSWVIYEQGACRQDIPSVYTRVSEYYDWINSHMR